MKFIKLTLVSFFILLISTSAFASLNLNVKIGQLVGNKLVEINKTISAEYGKEIVISSEGFKNKIILNLKKFSNVLVNGNKINPVQVDMCLVNEMKKIIGKPQTVTSFYSRSAQFAISSTGDATEIADVNVSLNFEDLN